MPMLSKRRQELPIFLTQLLTGWRLRHEQFLADIRHKDVGDFYKPGSHLHVLDVANGQLQPQAAILAAEGHEVFGVDLVNQRQRGWVDTSYRLARWVFRRQVSGKPIEKRIHLACGDVGALPFPDSSFDLVSSVAAFEHFLDVPAVVGEIGRVLRPEGIAWICIHPFTCPSGGHNVTRTEIPLTRLPQGISAWDHLRKRELPFDVPLNEWRISQYQHAFAQHFEIMMSYCAMREGERLLTPELASELAAYSREELTCLAYILMVRRLPTKV